MYDRYRKGKERMVEAKREMDIVHLFCDVAVKNICHIEHSRHRSVFNFIVNLVAGLIAYTYRDKKPSLNFHPSPLV